MVAAGGEGARVWIGGGLGGFGPLGGRLNRRRLSAALN